MNKKELKAIAERYDAKNFNIETTYLERKENLKTIFGLEHLSTNSIIKTMVECNFPTLEEDKTIEKYANWFIQCITSSLSNIKYNVFKEHYLSDKRIIEKFIKNSE